MSNKNEKIDNLVQSSVERLNLLTDANMVVGAPIMTISGYQIIPFSKVTIGNLSGGGEYGDVKVIKETDNSQFAGGSGAVVSMKPMGFLVDDGHSCKILRITDEAMDTLIERAGEILRDVVAKD